MVSEPSGDVLKRLVLAIWKVIKLFKCNLEVQQTTPQEGPVFCCISSFLNVHFLTFQLYFISVKSKVKDLTIVRGEWACACSTGES